MENKDLEEGFALFVDGKCIAKEADLGNAMEHAMVLEEMGAKVEVREFVGCIISCPVN